MIDIILKELNNGNFRIHWNNSLTSNNIFLREVYGQKTS